MRTLVYIILGGMILLLMASFIFPSCSPENSSRNSVTILGGQTAAPRSDVTVVSVGGGEGANPPQPSGQSLQVAAKPTQQVLGAQAVYDSATATQESAIAAQAATLDVVQAQQVVEAQRLDELKADPVVAQAIETQQAASASNRTLATSQAVEIAAASTREAFAPTATVQAAQLATAQVKAYARATATVKAAKSELSAIEAQMSQAEKSLNKMKTMGLATDGVLATLEALKAQAQGKVDSMEQMQAQGWMPGGLQGGMPGYGPTGGTTYVVLPGDTWYSISRLCGVPVNELAAANGMSPYQNLRVGQMLVIPGQYPGPMPIPMPGPSGMYVVQPRDTLYSISRRFGVSLQELAEMNGIVDYNHIWYGQTLIIPVPVPVPYPPVGPEPWPPGPVWPPAPTVWPPGPTPWPWTPTPSVPTGNDVYYSTDGRFSVQYPRAWRWGTDLPLGYVMFWTREASDPFSVGFAVFSRSSSVWRPARDVLEDYKNDLTSRGLMSPLWGNATFTWDGGMEAYTLGAQLAMGETGYAGSNRVLARATARDDGSREYFVLTWAARNQWSVKQATLEALINTLDFTGS